MRPPVAGTVPRESLDDDEHVHARIRRRELGHGVPRAADGRRAAARAGPRALRRSTARRATACRATATASSRGAPTSCSRARSRSRRRSTRSPCRRGPSGHLFNTITQRHPHDAGLRLADPGRRPLGHRGLRPRAPAQPARVDRRRPARRAGRSCDERAARDPLVGRAPDVRDPGGARPRRASGSARWPRSRWRCRASRLLPRVPDEPRVLPVSLALGALVFVLLRI